MGYPIIFQTKIVRLSDGRILHLSLSGCSNDTNGRRRDGWTGKACTEGDFLKRAFELKEGSLPAKETDYFDLKIGSRQCTYYDYGEHLLRMHRRSVTFDELMGSKRPVTFQAVESVTVFRHEKPFTMSLRDFQKYLERPWEGRERRIMYHINYRQLKNEKEVAGALDAGQALRIYIA